jgi:hypothetical protein
LFIAANGENSNVISLDSLISVEELAGLMEKKKRQAAVNRQMAVMRASFLRFKTSLFSFLSHNDPA